MAEWVSDQLSCRLKRHTLSDMSTIANTSKRHKVRPEFGEDRCP